jgi:hypothetical protein
VDFQGVTGGSRDYRRRGIVRADHLTGGGFGFNSGTGRARGRGRSFGKLPGVEAELLRALAGAKMHRSNGSEAEQEVRCGGAGVLGVQRRRGGLGLGFPGVRVPLFVGRRNGLGVRAGRGARRDSWAAGVRGRRKRREEGGADGWGQRARKRGEEARLRLANGDGLAADVEAGIG